MSEWKSYALAELAVIRVSNVDKKSNAGESPVLLCNYMDAYSNDYVTEDVEFMEATATAVEIEKFKIGKGDVLITKDSETPYDIGIPSVVIDEIEGLVCGYHLALIKPRVDLVDPVFLSKQLASYETASYFSRVAAGSTRYGLSNGAISRTMLRAPLLDKQRKIARILQTIDQAIEKTEALIDKYQQIKTGLMHDLFTRGIGPDGQLRPPREEAPELYHETPIGWVPKEWVTKPLSETCEWYSGGTPSKSQEVWWRGNVPWLSPKDMKRFELSDTYHHVTRIAALQGSRIVPENTVFIVVRGMILAHSFPVVLSQNEFAFNQDIKALIGCKSLGNRFLAYWLVANANSFLKKTTESTHGTKRFDLKDLYQIKIGVPSATEQDEIVLRMNIFECMVQSEIKRKGKLKIQKIALMHDLLTGKVPVRVDTVAEPEAVNA
ncbi:restriction endonuclease subunit S [Halomonas sp. DQ26W]|uniref:restriction endonuclease subunit S n=1 Tax=Halomonas sp. DQ26W TaxID=2282311 RepID=UPI0015EFE7A5|nr:restriction endonuclease subunit S [Halomonas sp. DQ26W]